jgi:hypothetical protein
MRTELRLLLVVALAALAPSSAEASACIPGFDYAIFAKNTIQIQGNAGTDSWNSAVGTYATTNTCADADIGTNSTGGGAVQAQGASTVICGDGFSGAGSNPTSVFTGNGNITGSKVAQTTNQVLPNITLPSLANGTPFNPDYQNTNAVLAPDRTYGDVKCKNGSLTLSTGKYLVKTISLTSNCELRVTSGPVEVYFTDSLQMQAGVLVNSTNVPGNLVFYGGPAASAVQVQGGVSASFAIYAPSADCQLQGNVAMYGALVCDDVQVQGNAHIHYDVALQNLAGGGFACSATEISRATPVVADVSGQTAIVQGTFESPTSTAKTITTTADVATFAFPYLKGHMRARTAASVTTSESTFSSGTVLFDAGATGKIPTAINTGCSSFDGTCRNVFTITQIPDADGTSFHPPQVQFKDSNASTLGALIAPASIVTGITPTHWQTIVRTVLAGKLGGVDRSTVAVIASSPLAGLSTRPTIAYFGATDGMLHAVCASTGGTTETDSNICPSVGTELWAFLPRVQLPLVRRNTTRIDGSVRVVDAFGDFGAPATGTRSFRTILTLQTGYADTTLGAPAAVYALDVTDPANPIILWEYTSPSSPTASEVGVGLTIAAGPTIVNGKPKNLVVAQTTNGGTGGAGVVATALDLETGARAWQFSYLYPSPPRGDSAALPLPAFGVPGGAVGVDMTRQGYTTDFVMGDLFGNLWRLAAATGASRTGTGTPLFQFSTNKHPIGMVPAIYSDGALLYAAFASGGYTDPTAASWSAGTQSLIAINLGATGPYPIAETEVGRLEITYDLGTNEDAFAQVLVVGDQLFLTTDNSDVNATGFGTGGNTGHLVTYSLATSSATSVVIRGGAGSIANSSATLYSSSSDKQQQLATDALSTTGTSVDTQTATKLERRLWLRTK